MYLSRAKCFAAVVLVLVNIQANAQTGTVSNPNNGRENNPYSKYGIGELLNANNTVLRGMGNITSAYADPYAVNADNPASYPFLQRTTFELGAAGGTRSVSGQGQSYRTGTVSLSYLNLGLPIGKKGGLCLGFKPYTHTYYRMTDTANTTIGQVIRDYNGEGGLNFAYLGAARRFGGLSIGINAGYMFGSIRNTTGTVPVTDPRAYITEYTSYTYIGGILSWKAGAIYEHKLDSEYTLRVGATMAMGQQLAERFNAYQISTYNFGDTLVNDTTYNSGEKQGKLTLPMTYSIGVMLAKTDKVETGLDYTGTQWSDFKSQPNTDMMLGVGTGSYKISVGGDMHPDANSIRKYLSKVTYRLGVYYGKDYLKISNTELPVFGVTAGASLPFRRTLSKLHVAADVGRMGTTTNGLLQQTYVRFMIGISLNDKWFIPRKYE